jgi:predicted HicB family RNase H-like nuclease
MFVKDLNYFNSLNYNIIIEKQEDNGAHWYIAYTNELGKFACYGRGETPADAIDSFEEEKAVFIEYLFSEGKTIPEPQIPEIEKFSGFFNVRTSPVIHAKLVKQSKDMDISLNLYLNQILSAAVEQHKGENLIMNKLSELCGQLEKHHFEVTKQLNYQKDKLSGVKSWSADFHGPYLKTA